MEEQTPQSKFSLIECERRFNNKTLVSFIGCAGATVLYAFANL